MICSLQASRQAAINNLLTERAGVYSFDLYRGHKFIISRSTYNFPRPLARLLWMSLEILLTPLIRYWHSAPAESKKPAVGQLAVACKICCWCPLATEFFAATHQNKKAQLMLAYPRDAKTMKKFPHFEVITSSSQVGNQVFIVIKFLIQITSTYNNS